MTETSDGDGAGTGIEGEKLLVSAYKDLENLQRVMASATTVASLRYIHHRLASIEFEPTEDWALEHEMLTLAFVTTYARLINGGVGTGFSRGTLPAELRSFHDDIIDLRNKRYAHNSGHASIESELVIDFNGDKFQVESRINMETYIGGARQWKDLVVFLDRAMFDRIHAVLARLSEKTGRDWVFPSGPPPKWVSPEE